MVETARDKSWPLVAATFVVDFMAGCWWLMNQFGYQDYLYRIPILSAITLGHIGVIAIWLAFRPTHNVWSYVVPIVALGIVAEIRLVLATFDGFTVVDYASRTAVQMLGTTLGLWFIQCTIWRWLSAGTPAPKWEFSIRQILIWMTVTACFFGMAGRSTWSNGELIPFSEMSGLFAPPAIAIGVVVIARHIAQWYLRICGYIAVGALVAAFVAYGRNYIFIRLNVEFILQALFIAAWVEWGGIVPRRTTSTRAT